MSHRGTLREVDDRTSKKGQNYWTVLIDTEAKGEVRFNLWKHEYAGLPDSDGNAPVCDIHELIDREVIFDATEGKIKDEATGERWPSTITLIQVAAERRRVETVLDAPPFEPDEIPEQPDELRAVATRAIEAIAILVEKVNERITAG